MLKVSSLTWVLAWDCMAMVACLALPWQLIIYFTLAYRVLTFIAGGWDNNTFDTTVRLGWLVCLFIVANIVDALQLVCGCVILLYCC